MTVSFWSSLVFFKHRTEGSTRYLSDCPVKATQEQNERIFRDCSRVGPRLRSSRWSNLAHHQSRCLSIVFAGKFLIPDLTPPCLKCDLAGKHMADT